MQSNRKLQVAIDCRLQNATQGVGTAVIAFANALSASSTQEQEYTFIVREDNSEWIRPYIFGPCRLALAPESKLKSRLRVFKPLRRIWKWLHTTAAVQVPKSNGFLESHNCDIVHFPTQTAFITSLPSIYQPWDLQHIHYPEFFDKTEVKHRNKSYRALCEQAKYVCVQTNWGKQDLVENLQIPEAKIKVIRWGSVLDAYDTPSPETVQAAIKKFDLPSQFFFYPAATWPHKNHQVIIRALEVLKREYGLRTDVYFSGACSDFREQLDALARDLKVSEQVHFLGFVSPIELQSLFASATAMIFASKFEGFGLPLFESFQSRLPVLSSSATVLPEVGQDAALYFDPDSPAELAARMKAVLDDEDLRSTMKEKGLQVLSQNSMQDTVLHFQALYEETMSHAALPAFEI